MIRANRPRLGVPESLSKILKVMLLVAGEAGREGRAIANRPSPSDRLFGQISDDDPCKIPGTPPDENDLWAFWSERHPRLSGNSPPGSQRPICHDLTASIGQTS